MNLGGFLNCISGAGTGEVLQLAGEQRQERLGEAKSRAGRLGWAFYSSLALPGSLLLIQLLPAVRRA